LKRSRRALTISIVGLAAAGALFAAVAAKPAEALPGYQSTCSSCHKATPTGAVTPTPSKSSLAPGEAYTVSVDIPFTNTGKYGAWIANAAGTPLASVAAGPSATNPVVVSMTAPAAAGTYTYTAFGVRSTTNQSSGQAASATYQITVTGGGGGGTDTTAPTPTAPSKASVKKGKIATLKYQINDPIPNLGSATTTVTIKNAKGKIVKTIHAGTKPVNTLQRATFKCKLAKGKYTFNVTAVDAAGNASTVTATNTLTVK
jgi:hypothetical protein